MGKEIIRFGDFEIERINFVAIKTLFFETMWILVTCWYLIRFLVRKNYKNFIGYADEYKIKPFTISLPKTSAYLKSGYGRETKWMYFLVEDEVFLKNMIFGIKPAIILKKNLIANSSTIKTFWETKENLTAIMLYILMIKKFLK